MDSMIEDGKRHKRLYFEVWKVWARLIKDRERLERMGNAAPTVSKNMI